MKIIELEINNVRGIPYLKIKPESRTLVIWGQNGSGKSAVVDALDFLLTGNINRLTGEGTGDITLSKHGPHIGHKPEEANVKAVIAVPKLEDPVTINRNIANPGEVQIDCPDDKKEYVEFILDLAKKGQHVLTRREILRYITSQPKDRAQKIQDLLNISDIEEIRTTLQSVRRTAKAEEDAAKRGMVLAQGAINATLGLTSYAQEQLEKFVDDNRKILDGKPLDKISSQKIKNGIRKPTEYSDGQKFDTELVQRDIDNVLRVLSDEHSKTTTPIDKKLREMITEIKSDSKFTRDFQTLQLVEMGIGLVDEQGICPLCDTKWDPDELKEYLNKKIKQGKSYAEVSVEISKLSNIIVNDVTTVLASVKKLMTLSEQIELNEDKVVLDSWKKSLEFLIDVLNNPIGKYEDVRITEDSIKVLLAPAKIKATVDTIMAKAKESLPKQTPELNAWTQLTRIEENLKQYETASVELSSAEIYAKRANHLYDKFLESRNNILKALYDSVRDRFVELYTAIHKKDEARFSAEIKPNEAGLDLEVDFYGQGNFPPHAFHSEGHQDSMGICLYLSLAEKINQELIDIVILDDVVMSVDSEHRRQISKVLKEVFPNKQYIITTHDRTWAHQLKSEGLVTSKNMIEFSNWDINSGPQIGFDIVLWERIDQSLSDGDVKTAAFYLRNGLESYFSEACEKLEAFVKYNSSHRWELGDWCPSATGTMKELVKKGKRIANSQDNKDLIVKLTEFEDLFSNAIKKSQAEQWIINQEVHYNNWTNFTKEDLIPVVEAFKDLCLLFECNICHTMFGVYTSVDHSVVHCACGKQYWLID